MPDSRFPMYAQILMGCEVLSEYLNRYGKGGDSKSKERAVVSIFSAITGIGTVAQEYRHLFPMDQLPKDNLFSFDGNTVTVLHENPYGLSVGTRFYLGEKDTESSGEYKYLKLATLKKNELVDLIQKEYDDDADHVMKCVTNVIDSQELHKIDMNDPDFTKFTMDEIIAVLLAL